MKVPAQERTATAQIIQDCRNVYRSMVLLTRNCCLKILKLCRRILARGCVRMTTKMEEKNCHISALVPIIGDREQDSMNGAREELTRSGAYLNQVSVVVTYVIEGLHSQSRQTASKTYMSISITLVKLELSLTMGDVMYQFFLLTFRSKYKHSAVRLEDSSGSRRCIRWAKKL